MKKQTIKVSRQKIEEVTSLVKKLQKLTGKKVLFKESGSGEDDIFDAKNYMPTPKVKADYAKLKKRYGLLDAANEFVAQFGDTDVPSLMRLFDISKEEAEEILDQLDNGNSDDEWDDALDNEEEDQIGREYHEGDPFDAEYDNDEIDQPNSPFSDPRFFDKDDY